MRLAPPPLKIEERDGSERTDIFGYEEFVASLASLVENLEGPSVGIRRQLEAPGADRTRGFARGRAPGKKREIQDILARSFPPKAGVEGDADAMWEWRSGSLRSLVERVCEVLDVLGDPVPRRRH